MTDPKHAPCERKWHIQIGGAPPAGLLTPYTATGADLDKLCDWLAELGVRRRDGEPDAELRTRLLEAWDDKKTLHRAFGTPAILRYPPSVIEPVMITTTEHETSYEAGCNGCGTCPACLRYKGESR